MSPDDAQAKAASTYNSASDHYDDDANSFWERFGRRTIERLTLRRGARVRELWRLVAPGGKPDLYKDFNPWDRICDTESLRALFAEAGLEAQEVVLEPGTHELKSPDDWWSVVMGSGYPGVCQNRER